MRDGKLLQFDSPEKILTEPASDFVRDFVGGDRTLKRLNLLKVKMPWRVPPVIRGDESLAAAREKLSATDGKALIVVDEKSRLLGLADEAALGRTGDRVEEVLLSTEAWIDATASLKDGLSEILSHDLGFVVAVNDERQVVGILTEYEIKTLLRK